MYSLCFELIPAACTLFHATPKVCLWINGPTKPHQPGFGAILLQPHHHIYGNSPLKKRPSQTFQRKTMVISFIIFPVSRCSTYLHLTLLVGENFKLGSSNISILGSLPGPHPKSAKKTSWDPVTGPNYMENLGKISSPTPIPTPPP